MRRAYVFLGVGVVVLMESAASPLVTYAGGSGNERFYCAMRLSDGTFLVGGKADDLMWISPLVPRTELAATTATGTTVPAGTVSDVFQGRYAFILRLSADCRTILHLYHFPAGIGGAIRDIKTDAAPGAATGGLYLCGLWRNTASTTLDHCWIGKLDANVVTSGPQRLAWVWTEIMNGGSNKFMRNWDVGGDGKVVYSSYKAPAAGAWHAVYRLKADGTVRDTPPNWWDANPYCVSLKPGNNHLRSLNWADYHLVSSHSGKSKKRGRFPHDFYFAGPAGINDNPGGYTGYRSDGSAATVCAIAVDRRDNTIYVGFNTPVANNTHDFEPTVMAMKPDGALMWYSHLYDEWTDVDSDGVVDAGETHQSPPDQYVDAIAIDYSRPVSSPEIIVVARSHGNAPKNFWSGSNSFHNQFTGTNGNEHLSWIGRFRGTNGYFINATWLAEYDPFGGGFGVPYSDPILDGWPDHNKGWASLKTTRLQCLAVGANGEVVVTAMSRGPLTTSNAFQKMPKAGSGQYGPWAAFVRVHTPDFSTLLYSSSLTGAFDPATGNGGDNTVLPGVCAAPPVVLVVGYHKLDGDTAKGAPIPTANIPPWGRSVPQKEDAILALLEYAPTGFSLPRVAPGGDVMPAVRLSYGLAPPSVPRTSARYVDIRGRITSYGTVGLVLVVDRSVSRQRLVLLQTEH